MRWISSMTRLGHRAGGGSSVGAGARLGGVVAVGLDATQHGGRAASVQVGLRGEAQGEMGWAAGQERIGLDAQLPAILGLAHLPTRASDTEMSRRNCGPGRWCETAGPVPEHLMQSPDPVSAAPSGRPKHRGAPILPTRPFIPDFAGQVGAFSTGHPQREGSGQLDAPPGCWRGIECRLPKPVGSVPGQPGDTGATLGRPATFSQRSE